MKKTLLPAVAFAIVAAASINSGCRRAAEPAPADQVPTAAAPRGAVDPAAVIAEQMPLGNPSAAGQAQRENLLLVRGSFVISYNDRRGTANWAAWKIDAASLGRSVPRAEFRPDPQLPANLKLIKPTDYTASGYDRGHIVASADRFGDAAANAETFYMTNIAPQTRELNQYPWQKLEAYARRLARRGSDVYVYAGVLGEIGRIRRRVSVPASYWKILFVVPAGADPIAYGPAARVVAVEMPNRDALRASSWSSFKTSVRDLENKTGYDFFTTLPRAVQDKIESEIDGQTKYKFLRRVRARA